MLKRIVTLLLLLTLMPTCVALAGLGLEYQSPVKAFDLLHWIYERFGSKDWYTTSTAEIPCDYALGSLTKAEYDSCLTLARLILVPGITHYDARLNETYNVFELTKGYELILSYRPDREKHLNYVGAYKKTPLPYDQINKYNNRFALRVLVEEMPKLFSGYHNGVYQDDGRISSITVDKASEKDALACVNYLKNHYDLLLGMDRYPFETHYNLNRAWNLPYDPIPNSWKVVYRNNTITINQEGMRDEYVSQRTFNLADATPKPTAKPTAKPTVKPTAKPTPKPTVKHTPKPTAKTKDCKYCKGRKWCQSCSGSGRCWSCGGSGYLFAGSRCSCMFGKCSTCSGKKKCFFCKGTGKE